MKDEKELFDLIWQMALFIDLEQIKQYWQLEALEEHIIDEQQHILQLEMEMQWCQEQVYL